MDSATEIHEQTSHDPATLGSHGERRDPESLPRPFKQYDAVPKRTFQRVRAPQSAALRTIAEGGPDPLAGTEQRDRVPVDLSTIATLCYYAAGVKGQEDYPSGAIDRQLYYRMASCTGNLHHIDAYVVCDDRPGLDAGVYHFDPASFSLDVLRTGAFRRVLAAAAGEATGVEAAPVSIVLTSTWWRNAWKYRDRAYRHAFWDTGTILANLLATAHAFDLSAVALVGFDDHGVADLLGVDPRTEAPIAVVPVGWNGADTQPARPADSTDVSVEPLDLVRVPQPPHERTHDLPYRAWEASTVTDGDAVRAWRDAARSAVPVGTVSEVASEGRDSTATQTAGRGGTVALDPVDHETATARPLSNAIRRRRSVREFSAEPLSRRKLGTVLDRATRPVPVGCRPAESTELCCTNLYVLATNVDEVPDGTYQYHPGTATLERIGDATAAAQTHLALNQEWAGDAHVNVYCTADVDAVVDALGDRGYRLAQLEAGVVLGRLYLATYAHRSLAGTGLTFFDDVVTDHLSPHAATQSPMTLFAMGVRD